MKHVFSFFFTSNSRYLKEINEHEQLQKYNAIRVLAIGAFLYSIADTIGGSEGGWETRILNVGVINVNRGTRGRSDEDTAHTEPIHM